MSLTCTQFVPTQEHLQILSCSLCFRASIGQAAFSTVYAYTALMQSSSVLHWLCGSLSAPAVHVFERRACVCVHECVLDTYLCPSFGQKWLWEEQQYSRQSISSNITPVESTWWCCYWQKCVSARGFFWVATIFGTGLFSVREGLDDGGWCRFTGRNGVCFESPVLSVCFDN